MPNFTDKIYLFSSASEGPESQARHFALRHHILQRKFFKQNRSLHDRGAASSSLLHPLFFPYHLLFLGLVSEGKGLGLNSKPWYKFTGCLLTIAQFIVRQSLHPQPVCSHIADRPLLWPVSKPKKLLLELSFSLIAVKALLGHLGDKTVERSLAGSTVCKLQCWSYSINSDSSWPLAIFFSFRLINIFPSAPWL